MICPSLVRGWSENRNIQCYLYALNTERYVKGNDTVPGKCGIRTFLAKEEKKCETGIGLVSRGG